MRKVLIVLTLVVVTSLATAGNASAQRRVFGGWGAMPYYSGAYYYGDGFNSPYYPGYGYSPGYYNTAPRYGVDSAAYYYAEPAVQVPMTRVNQSFYLAPEAAQQFAAVTVLVPTAETQVWFGDTAMTQQGMQRLFHSPSLEPGKNFIYTIKARWMVNGQPVERERQVTVQAGQRVTVNFRDNSGEAAPAPAAIRRN